MQQIKLWPNKFKAKLPQFLKQDIGSWLLCALAQLIVLCIVCPPWKYFIAGHDDFAWAVPQFLYQVGFSYSEYTPNILGGATPLSVGGLPFFYFLYSLHLVDIPLLLFRGL